MKIMRKQIGFTLIELLIVVAIIAVLAAIGLPNFLEAQTRAKVSATANDLSTMATGLEIYRVDNSRYPKSLLYQELEERLQAITTPVAYLTSIPNDPFWKRDTETVFGTSPLYVYASGNLYAGGSNAFDKQEAVNTIYSLAGRGPDTDIDGGGYCVAHPLAVKTKLAERTAYDPTNGTISNGDIYRLSPGTLGNKF
jgi:type II secretion system protein G